MSVIAGKVLTSRHVRKHPKLWMGKGSFRPEDPIFSCSDIFLPVSSGATIDDTYFTTYLEFDSLSMHTHTPFPLSLC